MRSHQHSILESLGCRLPIGRCWMLQACTCIVAGVEELNKALNWRELLCKFYRIQKWIVLPFKESCSGMFFGRQQAGRYPEAHRMLGKSIPRLRIGTCQVPVPGLSSYDPSPSTDLPFHWISVPFDLEIKMVSIAFNLEAVIPMVNHGESSWIIHSLDSSHLKYEYQLWNIYKTNSRMRRGRSHFVNPAGIWSDGKYHPAVLSLVVSARDCSTVVNVGTRWTLPHLQLWHNS